MTTTTNLSIANEILAQLGGRKFIAMTGSKNFCGDKNSLSMHLTKNLLGAKFLKITLDAYDTYTMTFSKIAKNQLVVLSEESGIYADMLQKCFTEKTGLLTRLF